MEVVLSAWHSDTENKAWNSCRRRVAANNNINGATCENPKDIGYVSTRSFLIMQVFLILLRFNHNQIHRISKQTT